MDQLPFIVGFGEGRIAGWRMTGPKTSGHHYH
jgi:hypothetical protein